MRYIFALSAVILAAVALPADIPVMPADIPAIPADVQAKLANILDVDMPADIPAELLEDPYLDPARHPDAFTTNANYTTERVPYGQAGFASMNGGTHGGNGGAVWTVWDPWALRDAISGNDRRVVYIRGRIDLSQLFTSSPGVRLGVGSFKTIVAADGNAMIFGGGLVISGVQQVIIMDIRFHNAISYAPGERPNGSGGITGQVNGEFSEIDALGIERGAEYVWIYHCEFADDPWNAINTAANRRRHDGLIDITRGASMITINDCIFRNHNHVSLVGNGDGMGHEDRGRLRTTWYNNWFQGTVQRNPRVRFGQVHVVNNLYTGITSYGIGVGVEAQVHCERNMFINTRRAWGWASGVPNPMGFLFNNNNWLSNSGFDSGIPGNVNWQPAQFYPFAPRAASAVEAHVRRFAGPRLR